MPTPSNRLAPRAFQRIPTGSAEADKVAEESARSQKAVADIPMMNGLHIKVPSIAPGADLAINHGLGRNLRGWFIADCIGGPPLVWRVSPVSDKTLTLHNGHTSALGLALWVW